MLKIDQIVQLSKKFRKFWYQIMKLDYILAPISEYFEKMTHAYTSLCNGIIV